MLKSECHLSNLTLGMLWEDSVYDKLLMYSIFSQKTGFDISCKLSPYLHKMSNPVFGEK